MALIRQPLYFLVVGGLQAGIDTLLFGLMVSVAIPTERANVISRLCAAVIGFLLNRYLTFQNRNETLSRLGFSMARFVILWIALTVLSTASIMLLETIFGAGTGNKIGYKIGVEAVLAVLSFFAAKYWVYRT